MMRDSRFGVLYVATGSKYIDEAIQSAHSVRKAMPGTPIAVFTDDASLIPPGLVDYTHAITSPTHSFSDKILPLLETPFDKTLFLDTDTLMIEPVDEISVLLDRFDLAYCHAPWRGHPVDGCPGAFPEPNSGVIAYRSLASVKNLFVSWAETYASQMIQAVKPRGDQAAFRIALYASTANFMILPPEYNFRTVFPGFAGGDMKVKILHGRGRSLARARKSINKRQNVRIADFSQSAAGRLMRFLWR